MEGRERDERRERGVMKSWRGNEIDKEKKRRGEKIGMNGETHQEEDAQEQKSVVCLIICCENC